MTTEETTRGAAMMKIARSGAYGKAPSARPCLRWAGGKGKLLPELFARLPERFVGYHEPFVGGGALFWELASCGRLKKGQVVLSDTCEPLVRTYRALKNDVSAVMDEIRTHPVTEERYYAVRGRTAEELAAMSDTELAGWFIFVNKANFNGLWRVNKQGVYNVPWGRWPEERLPNTCDEENLRACSEVLQGLRVALNDRPFENVLHYARPADLVYFDPPYLPVSATSQFTSYTVDGFGYDDHVRLRDVARELKERGVNILLSNADVPLVRELYESWRGFTVEVVGAPRSINSKGNKRGKVREVIVR